MSAISLSSARDTARPVALAATDRRWLALDLLRFLAVLLMVQGHTFTALIEDAVRELGWYRWHSYIHGYTAPLFMYSAGLAFGVTTLKGWAKQSEWGPAARKRVFRYLLIVAIGYALQLPSSSLLPLFRGMADERWGRMLAVNALQVIGMTLLLCQLLVLTLRNRSAFVALSALGGTAVVLLGPYFWRWPVQDYLPVGVAAYFTNQTGSLFPIVPWAGFIFAGIVTAALVGDVTRPEHRARVAPRLALAGGAIATAAVLLDRSGLSAAFGEHNFWKTSPLFFLWRLGCILPVLGLFGVLEQWYARWSAKRGGDGPVMATVRVMGQESLVVYVGHLVLLYGFMLPWSMNARWSHALALGNAVLAFSALFVVMIVLARVWHHVKTRRPTQFDLLRWGLGLGTLFMLLTRG
ncbi:MAG: heparan-alpha-glucosaminide N-acetyltransferase domain-containing protein [Myxococcota bacterium]